MSVLQHLRPNIFISYSIEYLNEASLLYKLLRLNGLRVWMDLHEIHHNVCKYYNDELDIARKYCDVFICFVDVKYSQTTNCLNEFKYAFKTNKCIISLLLDRGHLFYLGSIAYMVAISQKVNYYEDVDDFLYNADGPIYNKLLDAIRFCYAKKKLKLGDTFGMDLAYKLKYSNAINDEHGENNLTKFIKSYRSEKISE